MKNNHLLTVYAKLEHTRELPASNPKEIILKDVQIYKDKKCKQPFGRFMWYMSNKPTKRNKYVTLNCFKWNLVWLDK